MAELAKKRSVISAEKEKIKIRDMMKTIYKEQKKRRLEAGVFFH